MDTDESPRFSEGSSEFQTEDDEHRRRARQAKYRNAAEISGPTLAASYGLTNRSSSVASFRQVSRCPVAADGDLEEENESKRSSRERAFKIPGRIEISEENGFEKDSVDDVAKESIVTKKRGAEDTRESSVAKKRGAANSKEETCVTLKKLRREASPVKQQYKGLDADLVALIEAEILEVKSEVSWDSISGLSEQKAAIKEMVLWPLLRPDLFHGIRAPPKGLLLYGPPGTGKTLIGRCIASHAKATFFNISASSLTSKWVGEGEKLVRTLFEVARLRLPAVIFIDEVDSLLCSRSENEHESSRRIKTEFLQQLDGAKTNAEDRLLLVGATNRPHELDSAARRRFTRRIYIPLPDEAARRDIIERLLVDQKHCLLSEHFAKVAEMATNYSCADVTLLCKEAALGPIRALDSIEDINLDDLPPITVEHFEKAFRVVGPSVSLNDLTAFKTFSDNFGYNSNSSKQDNSSL